VTAALTNYPTISLLTPPTQKLGTSAFAGIPTAETVTSCCINGTLTASDPGLSPSGTNAYQWPRNGAVIAGATASAYTLTALDLGTHTSVRVTTTKTGFTPVVKFSNPVDYSITRVAPQTISSPYTGQYRVGDQLRADLGTFQDSNGGSISPALAYQWYRNGVTITGATPPSTSSSRSTSI